jgi:hypothetical protein
MLSNFGPVGILPSVDCLQHLILAALVLDPVRRNPDVRVIRGVEVARASAATSRRSWKKSSRWPIATM